MTQDTRPPDWEWVKATEQCSAEVMFGRLRELANRDVGQRNQQLGRADFSLQDINGIHFSVSKKFDGWGERRIVFFRVLDDLKRIAVTDSRDQEPVIYAVGLDAHGECKLSRGDTTLAPWQVLKASLEHLFFH